MAETVEDDSKVDDIIKSAERLVHKDQMGEVYKVCCVTTGGLPTGFEGEEQFLFPVCCAIPAASLGRKLWNDGRAKKTLPKSSRFCSTRPKRGWKHSSIDSYEGA